MSDSHTVQLSDAPALVTADGMPKDRDALQKMLNSAYRKGNSDAHAAFALARRRVGLFGATEPSASGSSENEATK